MRRVARAMLDKRFYLETVTAVDFIDHFELVYLYSTYYQDICRVMARIQISKEAIPLFDLGCLSRGHLAGAGGL